MVGAAPIAAAEFGGLIARLGPFEPNPHLAVAVSGGADSMALALLSYDWARTAGGQATALVVDHGLRPESAAEACQVADWLGARNVPTVVLAWTGDKPRTGIQARARAARYSLLAEWCANAGVLHLLVGHHREDQAETVLMRRARASGDDGLAAMAPIVELASLRLLRPLLDRPKSRLIATLSVLGQSWIEDPSNRDPTYWRVRLRAFQPVLDDAGLDACGIAAGAQEAARARVARARATASLLARIVDVFPAGYVRLDGAGLVASGPELGRRALTRCLLTIGGATYAPRRDRLDRLYDTLVADMPARRFKARTLAGCRVQLWPGGRRAGASVLICRETAAMAAPVPIRPGETVVWDGRFTLRLSAHAADRGYWVGALGAAGWAGLRRDRRVALASAPPPAVRPSLPSLWNEGLDEVLAIPHLDRGESPSGPVSTALTAAFAPAHALGPAEFSVA
ncbi:MAG: tRNA lysidine(34) synthetase TilS [Alphaproteobacteria bacterium]|nr:tRNA lysidine(34) synthetase TilS [Alphaproteobacteria bacterium]